MIEGRSKRSVTKKADLAFKPATVYEDNWIASVKDFGEQS